MKFKTKFKQQWYWIIFLFAFGVITTNIISGFASQETEPQSFNVSQAKTIVTTRGNDRQKSVEMSLKPSEENDRLSKEITLNNTSAKPSKLGHFAYEEAEAKDLVIIASYAQGKYQRYERLHKDAALALMRMIYAARDEGVWIVPVSGYRDIEKQELLFKAQVKRRGSEEAAAKLSAPPGHSEHHTGYTIDLTDGHLLNQDITYEFASTEAYQWLVNNADKFDFELSFPENNSQGVSYEPWHWRYVGSPDARKKFAKAKSNT